MTANVAGLGAGVAGSDGGATDREVYIRNTPVDGLQRPSPPGFAQLLDAYDALQAQYLDLLDAQHEVDMGDDGDAADAPPVALRTAWRRADVSDAPGEVGPEALDADSGADLRSHLLSDLYEDPTMLAPPVALVDRFLYRGSFTILSGQPKSGKTTLMTILCAALGAGCDFFTGAPGPARRVLFCSLEEEPARTIQRLKQYGAPGATVRLFTRSDVRSIGDIARELSAAERAGAPFDAILIDSLRRLAVLHDVTDGGSAMQWRALLEQVVDLVRETERTLGLLHHQRRPKAGERGGTFADSGDIAAVPDCLMEMDALAGTRRRFTPLARWDSQPFTLELTSDRYMLVDTTTTVETAVDLARVLDYVRTHPDCSRRAAASVAPGRQAERMAHVNDLVRTRALIDVGTPFRAKLRISLRGDTDLEPTQSQPVPW